MTLFYLLLGIAPSLVWLSIYLREDEHPEPNSFLILTFFLGALSAPLAAGVELGGIRLLETISLPQIVANFLVFFVIIALVEEAWKYFSVKLVVAKNKVFDEPTDAMIYLIVAGLGFAAVENVLALFNFVEGTSDAFELILLRFLSATLLHVLASAIVGYYLARQHFFGQKYQVIKGLVIAASLHGLYNILALSSNSFQNISVTIYVVVLLGLMAILVNFLFYKLKKNFFQ